MSCGDLRTLACVGSAWSCVNLRETILSKRNRGLEGPTVADSEFLEALGGGRAGGDAPNRQVERKTKQFCRQVQRALNYALADHADGLFAEEVSAAPDCGRLLVRVLVPEGQPVGEAMAALGAEVPRLRGEVARATNRKRAPELRFVPVQFRGGGHE